MIFFNGFLVFCMAGLVSAGRGLYDTNNVYSSVSVMDYGAVGDGVTDDTQAFLKTWEFVCKGNAPDPPDFIVPMEKKFLLKPVRFEGPCMNTFNIQVFGTIIAPSDPNDWGLDKSDAQWILFENVNGLTISGSGLIDGQGSAWWNAVESKSMQSSERPTAMAFYNCENVILTGLYLINSPRNFVHIYSCNFMTISELTITAPEDSPNTDGINIGYSTQIQVKDCNIGTGDDCIAFSGGSSNINVTGLACGPGHGISVGSLGANNGRDEVEEVHVIGCTLNGTTNGARIKTWQGGSGFARRISFEDITLIDVANPIIINQYYCILDEPCKNQTSAVLVSDILFNDFRGTSSTPNAINLSCSESTGCFNIVLNNINITYGSGGVAAQASCTNAYGQSTNWNIPAVDCLS